MHVSRGPADWYPHLQKEGHGQGGLFLEADVLPFPAISESAASTFKMFSVPSPPIDQRMAIS